MAATAPYLSLTAHQAFDIVAHAVHRPVRAETLVLLLDDAYCGIGLVSVTDTPDPDDVFEVVERVTHPGAAGRLVSAIVVASCRPGPVSGWSHHDDERHIADADIDRWCELDIICDDIGVELLDWFIVGHDVRYPRIEAGEPTRW